MAAPGENLRINSDRLWDSIMEMAKIGPGIAGGNNRQTVTDEDGEGRHLFKRWCDAAGLEMGVDEMGTMFARREGTDPSLPPVYVGSHLDTQPTGGKYDGVLGVLGGLEIVRSLNDLGIKTKHPIVVTNWTNEEGARFAPAMMASGVFAGVLDQADVYEHTDKNGKKFGEELERIGWKGTEKVGDRKIHAFFELHIEQGPILEDEDIDIGVVTHGLDDEVVAGARRIRPVLAEAGDRAIDKARVDLAQAVIVEPVFLQAAELEVLDQHIRRGDQPAHGLRTLRRREIDGDGALAAVAGMVISGRQVLAVMAMRQRRWRCCARRWG